MKDAKTCDCSHTNATTSGMFKGHVRRDNWNDDHRDENVTILKMIVSPIALAYVARDAASAIALVCLRFMQIRGRGASVERLTASPVLHASHVRTPLELKWVFPCTCFFLLNAVTLMATRQVKVETSVSRGPARSSHIDLSPFDLFYFSLKLI